MGGGRYIQSSDVGKRAAILLYIYNMVFPNGDIVLTLWRIVLRMPNFGDCLGAYGL